MRWGSVSGRRISTDADSEPPGARSASRVTRARRSDLHRGPETATARRHRRRAPYVPADLRARRSGRLGPPPDCFEGIEGCRCQAALTEGDQLRESPLRVQGRVERSDDQPPEEIDVELDLLCRDGRGGRAESYNGLPRGRSFAAIPRRRIACGHLLAASSPAARGHVAGGCSARRGCGVGATAGGALNGASGKS